MTGAKIVVSSEHRWNNCTYCTSQYLYDILPVPQLAGSVVPLLDGAPSAVVSGVGEIRNCILIVRVTDGVKETSDIIRKRRGSGDTACVQIDPTELHSLGWALILQSYHVFVPSITVTDASSVKITQGLQNQRAVLVTHVIGMGKRYAHGVQEKSSYVDRVILALSMQRAFPQRTAHNINDKSFRVGI
jgi:hypothetical protein